MIVYIVCGMAVLAVVGLGFVVGYVFGHRKGCIHVYAQWAANNYVSKQREVK